VTGHKDIPDEVVKRALDYDYEHWRDDRSSERPRSWGSVPPDQVRRLLFGAYGGGPVTVTEEVPVPVVFDERDLAVIGMHEERGEEE
jgi:hypothetical protein